MGCEFCIDENGDECLPQYGLAPHDHVEDKDGNIVATVFAPKDFWPDNFEPDPDVENMGTWHCEFCFNSPTGVNIGIGDGNNCQRANRKDKR